MRGRRWWANNGLKSLSTREIIAWSLLWRYCESFNSFWGVKYELYGFQQLTPIIHLWTECGVALENYKTHAHARRVCRHTHTRYERPSWHSRLTGFINDKPQLFTQHILFQTKERASERERGRKIIKSHYYHTRSTCVYPVVTCKNKHTRVTNRLWLHSLKEIIIRMFA